MIEDAGQRGRAGVWAGGAPPGGGVSAEWVSALPRNCALGWVDRAGDMVLRGNDLRSLTSQFLIRCVAIASRAPLTRSWSLVRRVLAGVFHGVSNKHLQGYLNAYVWRYNRRHDSRGRFQAAILRATLG